MADSVFLCLKRVFCVNACVYRAALRTAFPLKSDQEIDELVVSAQSEPDSSNDAISSQRPHSLVRTIYLQYSPQLWPLYGQLFELFACVYIQLKGIFAHFLLHGLT